jgi:5-methylcytosine-specific restriction protein A
MDDYFVPASPEHLKREKNKARELRQSQWWKGQLARAVCYHCEQRFHPSELTMDHLIPIVRGGKSDKKNCVPSCKDCNSKKGNKTTAELAMQDLRDKSKKDAE